MFFKNELLPIDRVLETPAQGTGRQVVQIAKQRRLPGVPEFRVGAAYVGNGQDVKMIQMRLVTHQRGEFVNHFRIADIFLLCRGGQYQVVFHEPRNLARIVLAHAMFKAEGLGIDGAEFRVITAAAFCDVVKEARQVHNFGFFQLLHDVAAVGVFVFETAQRKAPQITHHKQSVFIYGVGVEQVVLHASDDAAERGYVEAEHAVNVHPTEAVCNARWCPQNGQEQSVVTRVLSKLFIDQIQIPFDQAYRRGADAACVRVLLQYQE